MRAGGGPIVILQRSWIGKVPDQDYKILASDASVNNRAASGTLVHHPNEVRLSAASGPALAHPALLAAAVR